MATTLVNDQFCFYENNALNENRYNASKLSKSKIHKLKQLLKPVFAMLRSRKALKTTYQKSVEPVDDCCIHCAYFTEENARNEASEYVPEYDSAYESDQNDANEALEARILEEIGNLSLDGSMGVPVYYNHEEQEIVPVVRGQSFVPVHFAKTEAGTFFWTAVPSTVDHELLTTKAISGGQHPEGQVPYPEDRWAQA